MIPNHPESEGHPGSERETMYNSSMQIDLSDGIPIK